MADGSEGHKSVEANLGEGAASAFVIGQYLSGYESRGLPEVLTEAGGAELHIERVAFDVPERDVREVWAGVVRHQSVRTPSISKSTAEPWKSRSP